MAALDECHGSIGNGVLTSNVDREQLNTDGVKQGRTDTLSSERTSPMRIGSLPCRSLLSAGLLASLVCLFVPTAGLAGVWGAHDSVPAATLLVPFFEVGIDPVANPENTNLVVYARTSTTIHWEIWDIDGNSTFDMFGNVELGVAETWSASLASLLATAHPATLAQLTDGDFYRGFMTIDVVSSTTSLNPFDEAYPFGTGNNILGSIYYLRLNEGSANGLPMVGLEYTSDTDVSIFLEGFYGDDDHREEIDDNGRECGAGLTQGITPCVGSDQVISAIRARVFRSAPLSGTTRVIVFTWTTEIPNGGGPSTLCTTGGETCDSSYTYHQYREDGSLADTGTLTLPHVVNIIETVGNNPGELLILGIEDPKTSMQTYAFAQNAASPEGNPNINWDAIFEASIDP